MLTAFGIVALVHGIVTVVCAYGWWREFNNHQAYCDRTDERLNQLAQKVYDTEHARDNARAEADRWHKAWSDETRSVHRARAL